MAVNKVIYGNTTLVDLTSDTVTADNMAEGVRATGADGTKIVGLLPKVAIDNELSLTSTNPVQNKTITAALSNLDIDIATNDEIDNALNLAGSGDLPTGGGGIVPIALGGTGATTAGARTNLGVSATTDFAKVAFSGSYNDLTGTPTIPTATGDLTNNSGYITSSALNGYVKSVNGTSPDSNGNVSISVSGGSGGSVTVDAELSSTSTNAVQNKAVYAAVDKKLDKTGIAAYATRDSSGNVIINTYATKTDLNSYVKSINNVKPDSDGNVTISVGGGSGNYTLPTASSSTLGGVKIGSGLTINTSGVVSADVTSSTLTAYAKTTDLSAVATSGSYNDLSNKPTIPSAYTLPNATSSTLGGVKVGSNISVAGGTISITKSNVTSALGYTPPTSDTTYGNATTTSSGLMSSTDKVKLNGIANNANYYIHPPTHPASMISGLATVATSGSYNDLTNKPTIPEQITVDSEISSTSTNPVQNKIVYEVFSAVRKNLFTQINNLSAVAKSGSYNDLTDKPSNATTSSAGLMSAADKSKLDGISSDAGSVKMIVYS